MRIPPSVFVMSVVTAVPFGLAIKDTVHPPKTRAQIEEEKERAYEIDMEKQAQADREAEEQRTATVFGGLLGDKGKLGTYLDGLAIGAPADQAETIRNRTLNASDMIELTYTVQAGKVASIAIEAGGGQCEQLTKTVRTKWGEDDRWLDPATHTRAVLDEDNCALTLDHYVDVEQLLDKTTTASIPVGALGKTLDQLGDNVQRHDYDAGGALETPGLAQTDGNVEVDLTVNDAGKVVGMTASFKLAVEGDEIVRGRLDQLFGKGKHLADTGGWQWSGKVPVLYSYASARVFLEIGEP
jgi:hypothetical protein